MKRQGKPLGSSGGRRNGAAHSLLIWTLLGIFGAVLYFWVLPPTADELTGLAQTTDLRVAANGTADGNGGNLTARFAWNTTRGGYNGMDLVSNATMGFIEAVTKGNPRTKNNAVCAPRILANSSVSFLPAVVGEEFLHLGDAAKNGRRLRLLGEKLASGEAIEVLWFGGSNTQGRTRHPFVGQVQDLIERRYPSRPPSAKGHAPVNSVNRGGGGANSCTFARGFKSSFYNRDAETADLIFLETAITDGVFSKDHETMSRCFESLIRRVRDANQNAVVVALSLVNNDVHNVLIRHYSLPMIYLGAVWTRAPGILSTDSIHVNDIGSFLVAQAADALVKESEMMYNASRSIETDRVEAVPLPGRLHEPTEMFDWVMGFGKGGKGWAHDLGMLEIACRPQGENVSRVEPTGNCSASIMATWQDSNRKKLDSDIPCEGCPAAGVGVDEVGGGWVHCHSPWPAVCRPHGVHHHHCPSNDTSGIFVQKFTLDNRATDEWPAARPRQASFTVRLLKGYDEDFGKVMVVLWINDYAKRAVVTSVDTMWYTKATIIDDVKVGVPLSIPPPVEHGQVELMAAIVPLRGVGRNVTRCRIYAQSIVGEFV